MELKQLIAGSSIVAVATLIYSFSGINPDFLKTSGNEPFEIESCGVERWAVKVLSDGDANSVNIIPVKTTIYNLIHLTTPSPDPNMPRQSVEKQLYTIHCIVSKVKLESDGDYHLLLQDSAGNSMIGEIPDPTCPATTGSLYFGDIKRCRTFVDAHTNVGTSFSTINWKAVITGVAFVDPPHGQTDAAPNNLELHSILDIQFEPVHTSGIAENQEPERSLSISPNPFSTSSTLRFDIGASPFLHDRTLKIYDLRGVEVQSVLWPAGEVQINLERGNYKAGMYIFRLLDGEEIVGSGKLLAE